MENPFKSKEIVEIQVTDSELYCDKCAFVSDTGIYRSSKKELVWTCPNGHDNKVEIDLD